MAMNPEGSLVKVMDALKALEDTIHDDLRAYRWRPQQLPELPAVWNWMPRAPVKNDVSITSIRDTLHIAVDIGVLRKAVDEQMYDVETYADAFRAVVDPDLATNQPLDGAATKAWRTEMRTAIDEFGGVQVFCIEFDLQIQLDRIVQPNLT